MMLFFREREVEEEGRFVHLDTFVGVVPCFSY